MNTSGYCYGISPFWLYRSHGSGARDNRRACSHYLASLDTVFWMLEYPGETFTRSLPYKVPNFLWNDPDVHLVYVQVESCFLITSYQLFLLNPYYEFFLTFFPNKFRKRTQQKSSEERTHLCCSIFIKYYFNVSKFARLLITKSVKKSTQDEKLQPRVRPFTFVVIIT